VAFLVLPSVGGPAPGGSRGSKPRLLLVPFGSFRYMALGMELHADVHVLAQG